MWLSANASGLTTRRRRKMQPISFDEYLEGRQEDVRKWTEFIDRWKGDFTEQAKRKFLGWYTRPGSAFTNAEKTIRTLCDKVDALDWELRTVHEDGEGNTLSLLNSAQYQKELCALPELPLSYGCIESLLESAIPQAIVLREICAQAGALHYQSETLRNRGDLYQCQHIGTEYAREIVHAVLDRLYFGEIYRDWDSATPEARKELVSRADARLKSMKDTVNHRSDHVNRSTMTKEHSTLACEVTDMSRKREGMLGIRLFDIKELLGITDND